jgi:hypothetical protein
MPWAEDCMEGSGMANKTENLGLSGRRSVRSNLIQCEQLRLLGRTFGWGHVSWHHPTQNPVALLKVVFMPKRTGTGSGIGGLPVGFSQKRTLHDIAGVYRQGHKPLWALWVVSGQTAAWVKEQKVCLHSALREFPAFPADVR